jgi:hypothetical protein
MKQILLFITISLLTSCTKDEGGKCYDFDYQYTLTSTPDQVGYPIDKRVIETKCGLDDRIEAIEYSKTIGLRSNVKVVNGYTIIEGFTVIMIKEKK